MSTAQRFQLLFKEARAFCDTLGINFWTRRSLTRYRDNFAMKKFTRQRYKRDNYLKGALQCLRHVFDKPRRKFLMFSATAVCKSSDDEKKDCTEYITDEKMQGLVNDLVEADRLMKVTIFCPVCHHRRLISDKMPKIKYCTCKTPPPPPSFTESDGWVPYMEAKDVIIWRKQWKGEGQFAYKVYGRYEEIIASDLNAVQLDLQYRKVWDNAVASLTMVEEHAKGVQDQDIIHWEVMWPRLFANRDYVYVRRNLDYPGAVKKDKRKSDKSKHDKIYVIMSQACEHACCPENKNAIRVMEYWSHMVIRSLHGSEKAGSEYVLTYYDEPGSGGMPSGVAAWATGRAVPEFLVKMRAATKVYKQWLQRNDTIPQPVPVAIPPVKEEEVPVRTRASKESGMESAKFGPIIEKWLERCQEEKERDPCRKPKSRPIARKPIVPISPPLARKHKPCKPEEQEKENKEKDSGAADAGACKCDSWSASADDSVDVTDNDKRWKSWWRYLHPYYYIA